jgi:hypothetical protein
MDSFLEKNQNVARACAIVRRMRVMMAARHIMVILATSWR